ncbi:hypothetical protein Aple_069980 [Acrocarpospora pleiomorpha]|uniref:Uncharacterized protein n=1 Tax=Acrocarpospora pleiomorpha TaxID=90975 RepID=A0A5M3XVL5_9ACTN|nr:hypothetical protein [Acrocarpospora pleiomorpha]GES24099.1 hypothetical protein Aple_069980 [Acrocarpospora pleiomorpha]
MSTKARRKPVVASPPVGARAGRVSRLVVVVAVVAGLGGAAAGYLVAVPDASEVAIADLRKADADRDVKQIGELTTLAKSTAAELDKVLAALALAVPRDTTTAAQPAVPEIVRGWQDVVRKVAEKHAESPSGMTATNVARGGFRSAVNALGGALDTYALVQALPEDQRKPLLDLVSRQRSTAVMMWSVAATQLDQLNVDAGNGHQHAYLTGVPGDGAIAPDQIPEGTQ